MNREPDTGRLVCALGLVLLVVLAGCTTPFSSDETPTVETTTAPTERSPAEPTVTTTDRNESDGPSTSAPSETKLPPGVTVDGLDNASALLGAHTRVLEETGFVAVGEGNAVISRNSLLVEVETTQRNLAAAGGVPYRVNQSTVAGPIQREVQAWSNGSEESVRTSVAGETNYTTAEPRSMERLAGRERLDPYLRGGDFSTNGTENVSEGVRVVLVATEVANATQLQRSLPPRAEEVTSYEARIAVDTEGRIHSLEATVGYVIDGQEATHELDYTLEHVGEVDITRPDWVEDDRESIEGTE